MPTRVKETHCKNCLKKFDAHTSVEGDHTPEPGDVSLCVYCGIVSKFDEELNLVAMSDEELQFWRRENEDQYFILLQAAELIRQRVEKN